MNRLKRTLLTLVACLAAALLFSRLAQPAGSPGQLLPLLSAGRRCESLQSLGDLAEWVARQNETPVCRGDDDPSGGQWLPLYGRLPKSAGGGFPLCRLAQPPDWLERRILAGSIQTWVTGDAGRRIPVLGYAGGDEITRQLERRHSWEPQLVRPLLARLQRLGRGNATLLDIGCNIGVYSLQAAALGFPVVAVDANARNLARMALALRHPELAGAESQVELIWNFIAASAERPVRLNFPADCNIGGATRFERDVTDPVAVMPLGADALAPLVRTPLAVVKLDAEGGEADFLRTARRLFSSVTVAAVQMEWLLRHHAAADARDIVKFFDCRDYTPYAADGRQRLNIAKPEKWPTDILWLHSNYNWLL